MRRALSSGRTLPTRRVLVRLVPVLVVPLLALAACSGPTHPADPVPTATAAVTVDNCGTTVTVTAPPQRVVAIKSTAIEAMLALGLGDHLVGTAFVDGPVPPQQEDAYAAVPVLSDRVPGQEALLEVGPDMVYAGWESAFSADGVGERAVLAARGITTYVAPAACKEPGSMPDPMTFDLLFDQLRELASFFGVQDRADRLVAEQRALLATVTPPARPTTALWYSSGEQQPYVGAGIGAPQMMMEAAGLTNVFADVHDTWSSVGWEQVVAADPDVIVLVDASWSTAASKIAALEAQPATRVLTAVREGRYLTVPFPAAEAGVRDAEAVVSLAQQLAALDDGTRP